MGVHGGSFLLGLGMFGMVIGACFGLVVGKVDRECEAASGAARAEAAHETAGVLSGMCARVDGLRIASFGLVAMSALGALLPILQDRAARRAQ